MAEKKNRKTTPQNIARYEVLSEFEKIRQKQRRLHAELIDVEIEVKEFSEVAKILRECDYKRKCFRLINDLLVESNVENILPSFYIEKHNAETKQESLQIESRKSVETLCEFRRIYNIQVSDGLDIHPKLNKMFV